MIKRLLFCTRATAAVEAAIFAPLFMVFTLGVTDLGGEMFARMTVNAATQAGAAYAVFNSCTSPLSAACTLGIQQAMDDATGNSSFCTGAVCSFPAPAPCTDSYGGTCFVISVNYPYNPILPSLRYSWAKKTTLASTVTVRIK
jgi:hypothetical protein